VSVTTTGAKLLSEEALLGQRGIALIEDIVLQMKCRWSPGGPNETGIDGTIELYDQTTGAALSQFLLVQSKAVDREFPSDSGSGFDYHVSRRDLDYWRKTNVPVLLIVSRPSTAEAYWISVKRYFSEPGRRISGTIHFDKTRNRFSPTSFGDLLEDASSPDAGVHVGPLVKSERLVSNLLEIPALPEHVFVASTTFSRAKPIWGVLRHQKPRPGGCWIVKAQQLIGFHDFGERFWRDVCDQGTVERFAVSEWSDSSDQDRIADFQHLLRRSLEDKLFPNAKYRRDLDCYYWRPPPTGKPMKAPYLGLKRNSELSVFSAYTRKVKDRLLTTYRHLAFHGRFRRIEAKWFLEITPTYVFTWDGLMLDRFHSLRLSGIKRLEGNRAVVSQVAFWADYLRRRHDLFSIAMNPVVFGELATFGFGFGVDDDAWLKREEKLPGTNPTMELFDEM